MGKQIIKQPDGRFCLFSDNTNTLHMLDHTREEMIDVLVAEEMVAVRARWNEQFDRVEDEKNPKPYFQFTMSFVEAAETHLSTVRDERLDEVDEAPKYTARVRALRDAAKPKRGERRGT